MNPKKEASPQPLGEEALREIAAGVDPFAGLTRTENEDYDEAVTEKI